MDPVENIEIGRSKIRETADDLILHARVRRALMELDSADDAVLRALEAARQRLLDAAELYADQCDDLGRDELALGDTLATFRVVSGEVYTDIPIGTLNDY